MHTWIADERIYTQGRRYELPDEAMQVAELPAAGRPYLLLRPLTDAEALQRESLGIVEWYYLDGREPAVQRSYDLAAMADYDRRLCVLDFRLPVREGKQVRLIGPDPDEPEATALLLSRLPPRLARWVADCIADVNMRLPQQQAMLAEAKKK